jgi:type I restriction enzyme M protein
MKKLLEKIGFSPKENSQKIFVKKYSSYSIEVDLENQTFNYGGNIVFDVSDKIKQKITKPEDWVVFECVDRLLEKGYKPQNILLEKVYPTGHGTSGRLDILIRKEGKAFLMIECKTWGKEFEKEFQKMQKDGGQLFTYFQQDRDAEHLILYTSRFRNDELEYKNEIIKIEEDYRQAGNVKDFYNRWNKITKTNGLFEKWVNAYAFQNKSLLKKDLKPLDKEDSNSLFNKFDAILRKHSVSDHPNAFNKIFNLFLAKIFDEKKRDNDELEFQWIEGKDDSVDFQVRLINLYKEGVLKFLEKEIEGIKDSDFRYTDAEDLKKKKKKLLIFNKIFDIKEVFDNDTFEDNTKILKEFVELLSKYQIRYPRKQQHLSNFFEKLLTTGLKQRSGQYFTPPPIARYIIKSLPIQETIVDKLSKEVAELPSVIDYACGSGHFLTEAMEDMQNIIDNVDIKNPYPDVEDSLDIWKRKKFDWAAKYIYGVEKDYRLVKVAKVGCYFYGDGLAQIVYGDGLDNFHTSKNYRGLLNQKEANQDHPKFDFVISNPPYSVQHFKPDVKNKTPKQSFELFDFFTDQSKEIECLFIERTKQLLKDSGIAGIILPSSILSNTGIYTKTREIILKYFEIIGITQLGSATFMATGTNTVVLFLRRRNNYDSMNIQNSVDKFFDIFQDVNIKVDFLKNKILENPVTKYVAHTWENININDYISLAKKIPNEKIQEHEIFVEYSKKLKVKNNKDLYQQIIEIEKEKLLYFILAYNQKVVLTKTGEKKEEKQFLGYEFSNRRGHEGIHPIQRSKTIDECTSLFDPNIQKNPKKANFYTYKNFIGENFEIDESMQKNVSVIDLVDMMTFDRVDFEKTVSLNVKKKIKIESKWKQKNLNKLFQIRTGKKDANYSIDDGQYPFFTCGEKVLKAPNYSFNTEAILVAGNGNVGECKYYKGKFEVYQRTYIFDNFTDEIMSLYAFYFLRGFLPKKAQEKIQGSTMPYITLKTLESIKIPLPPKDIQKKIVKEIEKIEKKEVENKNKIIELKSSIDLIIEKSEISKKQNLSEVLTLEYGNSLPERNRIKGKFPVMGSNGIVGWHNKYLIEGPSIIVGRKGSVGKVNLIEKNNFPIDTTFYVNALENNDLKFIYFVLKKLSLEKLSLGTGVPGLSRNDAYNLNFGFPPISEQQKTVTQIEKIEQEIKVLKAKIKNSKKQKEEVLKKYL